MQIDIVSVRLVIYFSHVERRQQKKIHRAQNDLSASMTPAREVGGDFYDIFMTDDRHLALIIGDVSGKGVPASLFMIATKILLKYCLKQGQSPAEALGTTSEKLMESNDMDLFVTAWVALIDLETGECVEVNAGHEHPAVRRMGVFDRRIRRRRAAV